jgi:N-acetylmuramic acid 6-phosphate etherase
MIDMQLTNNKLFKRGVRMIMAETGTDEKTASELLKKHESVRKAIESTLLTSR